MFNRKVSHPIISSSLLLSFLVLLFVSVSSHQVLADETMQDMEELSEEVEADNSSPNPPSCNDTIADNKFVGNLFFNAANPCNEICGSIDIGYRWSLVIIDDNCVDANGNPLTTPATVEIDDDGLHSGYCIEFGDARASSCTPTAQLKCIEDDGTVVNHQIQKTFAIPEPQQDCECECRLGDAPATPHPTSNQCGVEITLVFDSECIAQSPTNCAGAPKYRTFLSYSADPCTGSEKNLACVLDQATGTCKVVQTTNTNYEIRTSYFLDCKDPALNQNKDCKDCQCGSFVDGANGPIRFMHSEVLLVALLLGQNTMEYGYECKLSNNPVNEEEPLVPQ